MATPTASLIKTKMRTIDGLSIRYAESDPREVRTDRATQDFLEGQKAEAEGRKPVYRGN